MSKRLSFFFRVSCRVSLVIETVAAVTRCLCCGKTAAETGQTLRLLCSPTTRSRMELSGDFGGHDHHTSSLGPAFIDPRRAKVNVKMVSKFHAEIKQ